MPRFSHDQDQVFLIWKREELMTRFLSWRFLVFMRKYERARPLVTFSYPARAVVVPPLKPAPLKKDEFGCFLYMMPQECRDPWTAGSM
ncbi:hypothetical protein A3Q37_06918 [Streptomyces sp. PTY087I2]|nr:hypothetical protein A3Q37_06918 [Streptomyces sp. PTY087I2]